MPSLSLPAGRRTDGVILVVSVMPPRATAQAIYQTPLKFIADLLADLTTRRRRASVLIGYRMPIVRYVIPDRLVS